MIPNQAHFVWFGSRFPYAYGLALKSAALNGGFDRVTLHCDLPLHDSPGWRVAREASGVKMAPMEPREILESVPNVGSKLTTLFHRLEAPAARSNMIRIALLFLQGGVYLDTDVLTVRSFGKLLNASAFCGEERIVLPAALGRSKNPARYLAAGARLAVRDLCRRLPLGWRLFRRIEHRYPAVVNNAVLGAEKGSEGMGMLLDRMVRMSQKRQTRRFALGTHLLEDAVADHPEAFRVHPASTFFPIGPEISEHWFKKTKAADLEALLYPNTVSVHWYASVRTRRYVNVIDGNWIRDNEATRPFAALAASMDMER